MVAGAPPRYGSWKPGSHPDIAFPAIHNPQLHLKSISNLPISLHLYQHLPRATAIDAVISLHSLLLPSQPALHTVRAIFEKSTPNAFIALLILLQKLFGAEL